MSLRLRDLRRSDEDAVRRLVGQVLHEYRLGADPADTDADLRDITASYVQRGGVFRVLADEEGAIVGCGGLYPLANGDAEIRKMYFVPDARGRGFGRLLLDELIVEARKRGYRRVVLETASQLKEAIALYRSAGFAPYQREHLACRCDQAFALDLMQAGEGAAPSLGADVVDKD